MFETSQDLLYGVVSFSVLIFTGFLVWILFYVAQILRQGNEVISDIRRKIADFEASLNSIKEKVISSATSVTFMAKEIAGIVNFIKAHKRTGAGTKKK